MSAGSSLRATCAELQAHARDTGYRRSTARSRHRWRATLHRRATAARRSSGPRPLRPLARIRVSVVGAQGVSLEASCVAELIPPCAFPVGCLSWSGRERSSLAAVVFNRDCWAMPSFSSAPDTVVVKSGNLSLRRLLWVPKGQGPFPCSVLTSDHVARYLLGPTLVHPTTGSLGRVLAKHGYVFLFLCRRVSGSPGISFGRGRPHGRLAEGARSRAGGDIQLGCSMARSSTKPSPARVSSDVVPTLIRSHRVRGICCGAVPLPCFSPT